MSIQDDIIAAAKKYGVDPATALAIARIESNFDPNAYNKSGASGLFQFMPGTAGDYGLTNPFDAAANIDAGMRLARDNIASLTKKLGRAPTAGEIYLAHQQGLGGAGALLANPNISAVDALVKAGVSRSKAIASVQQNGGDPNTMTAGQFAGLWTGKADKYAESYADYPGASPGLTAINNATQWNPLPAPQPYAPTPAGPFSTPRLGTPLLPPIPAGLPTMDRSGPATPQPITLPNGSVVIPGRPIVGADGSVTVFDAQGNRTHTPPPLFNLGKEATSNTILGGLIRSEVPKVAAQVSQQVGSTVNNALDQGKTLVADIGAGAGNLFSGLFGGGGTAAPSLATAPKITLAEMMGKMPTAAPPKVTAPPSVPYFGEGVTGLPKVTAPPITPYPYYPPSSPQPLPAPAPLTPPTPPPMSPLEAYLGGGLPYTAPSSPMPTIPPPSMLTEGYGGTIAPPPPLPPLNQITVRPVQQAKPITQPSDIDLFASKLRSAGITVTGNNKGFVDPSTGSLMPTTTINGTLRRLPGSY